MAGFNKKKHPGIAVLSVEVQIPVVKQKNRLIKYNWIEYSVEFQHQQKMLILWHLGCL
jgi:hypothetical protein